MIRLDCVESEADCVVNGIFVFSYVTQRVINDDLNKLLVCNTVRIYTWNLIDWSFRLKVRDPLWSYLND